MSRADYCINPDCRQIIRYEDGAEIIKCPWCENSFFVREFKGEQEKIIEALMAGKQAKAALDMTRKEKDAVQALLNKSQQAWVDNVAVQKHIAAQLDGIKADTTDIKRDTGELLGGQTKINAALNDVLSKVSGQNDFERMKAELAELVLQGVRDEMRRAVEKDAPTPVVQSAPVMPTVSAQTPAVQYAPESDFEVEIVGNECTITRYMGEAKQLVIPEKIKGALVTVIGKDAFANCSSLMSITIPDSVTWIGQYAFYKCSSLTSITIPEGVTKIGEGAFEDCCSLTSITIPENVTEIGGGAFEDCSSLTSITIPEGVTEIGAMTFKDCSSLTSITIPDSVTTIGDSAFWGCSSLTSITIPDGVTEICDTAFCGCSSLMSITIPYCVTEIAWGTFWGCSSLTSITIPDFVSTIRGGAFLGCSSLTSIMIPEMVTEMEGDPFTDCPNLTLYVQRNSYAHRWAQKKAQIWVPKDERVRFRVQ